MALFRRRGAPRSSSARRVVRVDPGLPDGEWLRVSEQQFDARVEAHYGSPETMAEGGRESYGHQEFGVALFFYRKAIDMLHTAYGYAQMQHRRPSPADAAIIDGFTAALGASLALHPDAPVGTCVDDVENLLRSLSGDCEQAGLPAELYRDALHAIAAARLAAPADG